MKRSLIMLFFVCSGIVTGSLIAHLTHDVAKLGWLSYGLNFGLATPFILDLSVLTLTLGATFTLNISVIIFTVLGVCLGLSVTRRRR